MADDTPSKVGMLQDSPNSTSLMRVVTFAWMALLFAAIIFLVIVNRAFPNIPESIVELTGLILTGKVFHSFSESWASKQ